MKTLVTGTRFKKDIKRLQKRGSDMQKLHNYIVALQSGTPLPSAARPHKLQGEWKEFWECHVESDWLLVYDVTETEVLLAGTGTHADLFR